MEIKRGGKRSWLGRFLRRGPLRSHLFTAAASSFLTVVLCYLIYQWHTSGGLERFVAKIRNPLRLLRAKAEARPDTLTIDVKFKHYEKLAAKRAEALETGLLFSSNEDYVPGTIRSGTREVPVRLRLKGDLLDHLKEFKWSFRVKVRGDETLFGMKRFSLQNPGSRIHLWEWLFHETLAREDIIALRYKFVNVVFNGKDLGIYALEEHFGKRLIEANRRREGIILKFDETLWWKERLGAILGVASMDANVAGAGDYMSAPIEHFQSGKVALSPTLSRQAAIASTLLDRYRRGEIPAGDVFDRGKMARYLALCDLFGTNHPIHPNQYRFYFNPVTSRLEPIPYDVMARQVERLIGSFSERDATPFPGGGKALFIVGQLRDPELHRMYVQNLERFSRRAYIDNLLSDLQDELETNQTIIHSEYPDYTFERSTLDYNQDYLRRMLNPDEGMRAFLADAGNGALELEMGAVQLFPVEVLRVELAGRPLAGKPVRLRGRRHRSEPVHFVTQRYMLPDPDAWSKGQVAQLEIVYRLIGTGRERRSQVFAFPRQIRNFAGSDLARRAPNVADFDWIEVHEKRKVVAVRAGKWKLEQDLVIPAGYAFEAGSGTTIDLGRGAAILCRSPLRLVGTTDAPVEIISSDRTGQGLVVLSPGAPSVLRHVHFRGLTALAKDGWTLTGAVTLYEADAALDACTFEHIKAEDGLNIIRASFEMTRCSFTDVASDAFDGDFTRGTVEDCYFARCGNDAVDVSGSDVTVRRLRVTSAGDKALSIGEHSVADVIAPVLRKCNVGVASKDLSRVTVQDADISECVLAFAAYQKKPEFGPARLKASGAKIAGTEHRYYRDEGSSIRINGTPAGEANPALRGIVE